MTTKRPGHPSWCVLPTGHPGQCASAGAAERDSLHRAAPDLLKALRGLDRFVTHRGGCAFIDIADSACDCGMDDACDAARDAIQKARGA